MFSLFHIHNATVCFLTFRYLTHWFILYLIHDMRTGTQSSHEHFRLLQLLIRRPYLPPAILLLLTRHFPLFHLYLCRSGAQYQAAFWTIQKASPYHSGRGFSFLPFFTIFRFVLRKELIKSIKTINGRLLDCRLTFFAAADKIVSNIRERYALFRIREDISIPNSHACRFPPRHGEKSFRRISH